MNGVYNSTFLGPGLWGGIKRSNIIKFQLQSKEEDKIINRYDQSKKDGKDQESLQSSTTPDKDYHMGKWQNYN